MLRPGDPAPPVQSRPVSGPAVAVPDPGGAVALVFVGPLGSPLARKTLAEAQARFADFDRRGVRLVAVSSSGLDEARDFVPRHHLLPALVLDPDGAISQRYGVPEARVRLADLGGLGRLVGALELGLGRSAAPATQAAFGVTRAGRLCDVQVGASPFDAPDLDRLLAALEAG